MLSPGKASRAPALGVSLGDLQGSGPCGHLQGSVAVKACQGLYLRALGLQGDQQGNPASGTLPPLWMTFPKVARDKARHNMKKKNSYSKRGHFFLTDRSGWLFASKTAGNPVGYTCMRGGLCGLEPHALFRQHSPPPPIAKPINRVAQGEGREDPLPKD